MTRIIPILLAILILLSACSDPLGIVARSQVEAAAQVQSEQIRADAQVQTARIDASTARIRVGGWMVAAAMLMLAVVAVAVIAGATIVRVNADRLYADAARTLPPVTRATPLPPVTRATPLPSGRPPSRRPALTQRPTLALPARSERAEDVIVIDA